jgi:hypothetical protein
MASNSRFFPDKVRERNKMLRNPPPANFEEKCYGRHLNRPFTKKRLQAALKDSVNDWQAMLRLH